MAMKYDDRYHTNGNDYDNDEFDDEKVLFFEDVGDANPPSRRRFIAKVYITLFFQLLVTAGAGFFFFRMVRDNEFVKENSKWMLIGFSVAAMVLMCTLSCCTEAIREPPKIHIFLVIFTLIMAGFVGLSSARFDADAIMVSSFITAGLFFGLTVFAVCVTKDFTGFGPYLFAASLVLILFGVAVFALGFFVHDGAFQWLRIGLSVFGVLLFSAYIVYDTQQIVGGKNREHVYSTDDYIFAAISLYLDVINLFMCLLGLVGNS